MRSSHLADGSPFPGPLVVMVIALTALGGAHAHDRQSLRCEVIAAGEGTDTPYFRKNCDDLKAILSNLVQTAPGLVSQCSAKAVADYEGLLNEAGSGVRPFIKQKVDQGLALLHQNAQAPASLTQLAHGYEEMAQDYDDALAQAALAVGDSAMAKQCLPIAYTAYRWILTSFSDARHAAIRQRAHAGVDKVRSGGK